MANIVKYNEERLPNSIKSGGFNIGVNSTPTDLTGFYNGISPINGGYTIYVDKAENGPSIFAPKDDNELVDIVQNLGGSVSTASDALVWINSQSNMTVVSSNYPSIVTDGLVLNLDAGFASSYPKTGTVWNDLSGNGNNGTLENGPTFDSGNLGSLLLDGINEHVRPIVEINLQPPWTQKSIYKNLESTSTTAFRASVHGNSSTSTPGFIRIYNDISGDNARIRILLRYLNSADSWSSFSDYVGPFGSSYVSFAQQDSFWVNNIIDLTITCSANNIYRYYINGELVFTRNRSTSGDLNNGLRINRIGARGTGTTEPLNGNIYLSSFYDRELTPQEILQNYYAGLQRFIPTDGLVLSLDAQNTNLYATSPTTAYDVSGDGNNGTLVNGTQYVGDGGGSWSFDGVDDFININQPSIFFSPNIWTICFWMKPGNQNSRFITPNSNGIDQFLFYNATNQRVGISIASSGDVNERTRNGVSGSIPIGEWSYFCVSIEDLNIKIYANSILTNEYNEIQSIGNWSGTWRIGQRGNNTFWYLGLLSDIKIYNRVLTQAEITTIYNATKTRYGIQ